MQHAGRAGSREPILEESVSRSLSRSGSGGRAVPSREATQEQSGAPHGRASFHGGAAPHPSISRPPLAGASSGEGTTVGGRGASRFREQKETTIVTRPSADFSKLGKIKTN